MSELKFKIENSMKQALKSQAKERLTIIRMIMAAIKQQEVDTRIKLTDLNVLEILNKMLSKAKEAVNQYQVANRDDLVAKELFEIEVIKEFLPQQWSQEQVMAKIQEVLTETGASSIKDMAKVMQKLRIELLGKADLEVVGKTVKSVLLNHGT